MAETAVQASGGLTVGGCLSHRAINQPHWSFPLPTSPSNWQTNPDSSILSHKALYCFLQPWHPMTPFYYGLKTDFRGPDISTHTQTQGYMQLVTLCHCHLDLCGNHLFHNPYNREI